ncbi:MAG: hypothetical protein DWQ01_20840 [Planctomycetota bacterium]|nr:MAG: hypothetical protein DWQ01_20840 [Planctomycetota bacterium]
MRKTLPVLAILLVIAALVWILSQDAGDVTPLPENTPATPAQRLDEDSEPEVALPRNRSLAEEEQAVAYDNRRIKTGQGNFGLFGTVVNEQGEPVPEAWVAAYSMPFPLMDFQMDFAEILEKPLNFELEPLASTRADKDGKFQLGGVPGRNVFLTARAYQQLTPRRQPISITDLDDPEGVVVRTRKAASLQGEVVDAQGHPVAGAEVIIGPGLKYLIASFRNRNFFMERTFTGPDGRFVVEAVPAQATLGIHALSDGIRTGLTDFGPLSPGSDGFGKVQLDELGDLSGQVVDMDGEGLSGATVLALPLDFRKVVPFVRDPMAWTTDSGAGGKYQFASLPEGNYLLLAQGRHGRSAPYQAFVRGPGSVAEPVALDTRTWIEGRVLDTEAQPIPRAKVQLSSIPEKKGADDNPGGRNPFGEGGMWVEAAREILPELLTESTEVFTDNQGRFKIPAWRRARLRVEAPGYVDGDFRLKELEEGKDPILVLYKPSGVEGVVIDSDASKPVRFYLIRGEMSRRSNSREVRAVAAREAMTETQVEQEMAEEAAQAAPQSALEAVKAENEQLLYAAGSWRANLEAVHFCEDPRGKFKLHNLPPGNWRLKVRAEDYATETVRNIELEAGKIRKGVVVNLRRGASVSGQVIAADTKEPVANAVVTVGRGEESGFTALLQGLDEDTAYTEADAQGYFTVQGVRKGSDHVTALAGNFAATSVPIPAVEADEKREKVLVEMPLGGTLTGIVRDRHGNPLPGRMVGAMSPQAKDLQQTATDKDGRYTMSHMRQGSYFMLTASLDDDSLFSGDMMSMLTSSRIVTAYVKEGEVTVVDIVDPSAGGCKLSGTLTRKGIPVVGANIVAMAKEREGLFDFRLATARTDGDGRFAFKSLAPGEYVFNVESKPWRGRMDVEIPDFPEFQLYLEVPKTEVSGQVVAEATGEALEDVMVILIQDDADESMGIFGGNMKRHWASTDENGEYRFEGISPGLYHLETSPRNWGLQREEGQLALGKAKSEPFNLIVNEIRRADVLRLPLAGVIEVKVVNSAGEDFKGGFQLRAVPVNQPEVADEEDWFSGNRGWGRNGSGKINGLQPGSYEVVVEADGYSRKSKKDVTVVEGETTQIEVVMAKGVELRARVLDANNRPVAADLKLLNQDGEKVNTGSGLQLRLAGLFGGNGDGAVPIGTFDPGNYTLVAEYEGEKREVPVTLIEGVDEVVEVNF